MDSTFHPIRKNCVPAVRFVEKKMDISQIHMKEKSFAPKI